MNSYGTVAEVAALAPWYVNSSGAFDTTTTPTETQVEKFIDRVSGICNVVLAKHGFAVPVVQNEAVLALTDFVIAEVIELVHAANGSGPFMPGSNEMRSSSPMRRILRDIQAFIGDNADGFEALGATRTRRLTEGLECRTTDEDGDELAPYFSRHQMGQSVKDWDS